MHFAQGNVTHSRSWGQMSFLLSHSLGGRGGIRGLFFSFVFFAVRPAEGHIFFHKPIVGHTKGRKKKKWRKDELGLTI